MIWWAIFVFVLSVIDDLLAVIYIRRVATGKRISAALMSGALTGLISAEVLIYVSEWLLIIPNALGSVAGTWLALWLEESLPRQIPRDSKGKFKRPPPREILTEKGKMV
jgi:hypothetical protein